MTSSVGNAPSSRRLLVARSLLALAALAATASGLASIPTVLVAPVDTRVVETWRMLGLIFFGGLFTLLASRPRPYRGLWEITLLNKLCLTGLAIAYGVTGAATDAWSTAVADGGLTALLVISYVLVRGWRTSDS